MSIQPIQSSSSIDWTSLVKSSAVEDSSALSASTAQAAPASGTPKAGGKPPAGGGAPAAKAGSSSSSKDDSSSDQIQDKRDLNGDGVVSAEEILEYALQQQEESISASAASNQGSAGTYQSSVKSSTANVSLEI